MLALGQSAQPRQILQPATHAMRVHGRWRRRRHAFNVTQELGQVVQVPRILHLATHAMQARGLVQARLHARRATPAHGRLLQARRWCPRVLSVHLGAGR